MPERVLRSSSKRRHNSPSIVYTSAPLKKQKRFPPKRKRVRQAVPDTPERKRQGTLTQVEWFEQGSESESEETDVERSTKSQEPVPQGTNAKAGNDETIRAVETPKKKPVRKGVTFASDEGDESSSPITSKDKKDRRDQTTLTQLDDFLTEGTILSGRVPSSMSSVPSRKRKRKLTLEEQRQKTLTQMFEVPASDDDELGMVISDESDAPSDFSEDMGTFIELSPACRDAMRVPGDLKQARRRSNLATQFTQNQENLDRELSSSPHREPDQPSKDNFRTPQKRRIWEVPSSQSPTDSSISTQNTRRFTQSPARIKALKFVEQTPSKRKADRPALFAGSLDSFTVSSRASTQIKEEPASSAHIPSSLCSGGGGQQDPDATICEANEETRPNNTLTPSKAHSGDQKLESSQPQAPFNGSPFGGPPISSNHHSASQQQRDGSPFDLDTSAMLPWTSHHDGPDEMALDTAPEQPLSAKDIIHESQRSGSSQAEAQLHSELQNYTQREALSRQSDPRSDLNVNPSSARKAAPPRNVKYPSQASTVDITQPTQAPPSTSPVGKAIQETHAANMDSNIQNSQIRLPEMLIPSSPVLMAPPPLSSPVLERVEDSQFGFGPAGGDGNHGIVQDSMGMWSIPAAPPLSSDDED